MKSSLKRTISLILAVVMITTTYNFNSFAVSFDNIIKNELNKIELKNKNGNIKTKYYEGLLSEQKQLLMNDDKIVNNDENNNDTTVANTTTNDDIDKTVENYINENNKNKQPANENNITNTNKNDNGNQVNDEDENENITSNEDYTINNKTNDATNKSTNNEENKNDVENNTNNNISSDTNINENENNSQVDIVEDDIIDDDIDSVVSDAIAVNDTSNLNNNDDELKNDIKQVEASVSTDSDVVDDNESQVFGDSTPKYIWFGSYPQTDITGVQLEPIKWRVLSQNGNELLLISDKVLDNKRYNESKVDVTWETCTLRTWLNSDAGFLGKAFNNNLKSRIKQKTILNPDNIEEGTKGGNDTNDKVFLLSIDEAQTLFSSKDDRIENGTNYARTVKNYEKKNTLWVYPGACDYWLRSPGGKQSCAAHLSWLGSVSTYGASVNDIMNGIRPSLYIDFSNDIKNNIVTWDKSSGWWFQSASILWDDYNTYIGGQKLPTNENILYREGFELKGWRINNSETVYTEIPVDQKGPITLSPVFDKIDLIGKKIQIGILNDNDYAKDIPLVWTIISIKDNKALLLVDDYVTYDNFTYDTDYTYKDSEIRHWLIDDFYNSTFSDEEKKVLANGNFETDKVFLLSLNEFNNNRMNIPISSFEERKSAYEQTYLTRDVVLAPTDDFTSYLYNVKIVDIIRYNMNDGTHVYIGNDANNNNPNLDSNDYFSNVHRIRPAICIDINKIKTITYDKNGGQWITKKNILNFYRDKSIDDVVFDNVHTKKYIDAYVEGVGSPLPDHNYIERDNDIIVGWKYNGNVISRLDTSISGDVSLTAVWKSSDKKNIYVGDTITFGKYEQDNVSENGKEDLEWTVIDINKEKNEARLFATKSLDAVHYNNSNSYKEYRRSDIRNLLNNSFFNQTFTEEEKKCIISRTDICEDGSEDKVWLLSKNEFNYYLNDMHLHQLTSKYSYHGVYNVTPYCYYRRGGSRLEYFLRDLELDGYSDWQDCCFRIYGRTVGRGSESYYTLRPGVTVNLSLLGFTAGTTDPIIEYVKDYKINWQLDGGAFKDEYKHYETDKHNDTEDFILPTEDMLTAPYGKVFKEWFVEGVATTSIAKEIKKDVSVVAKWTRSSGGFESYYIGKYKLKTDAERDEVLEWLILDKKDDKLLLMTKDVIDNVSYDTNGNTEFKNSSIKKWLNKNFYENAFDDKQKRNILNNKNNGKVFLLTEDDYNEYFVTNLQSIAEATNYATNVKNGNETLELKGNLSPYWLMTHSNVSKVPYVSADGSLNKDGAEATAKTIGVRPCVWVEEKKMEEVKVYTLGELIREMRNDLIDSLLDWLFGRK